MQTARSLSILLACLVGVLLLLLHEKPTSISSPTERQSIQVAAYRNTHAADLPRCGTWQADYIALHRSILDGTLPPRYLVSVAVEAGLADRLTGTLTEFFLALFTRRAFQIVTYSTLPRFEAAFLAPHINWSRPTDPDKLIDNVKLTYRGIRGYTGNRSYDSSVNTSLYWPIYLINNDLDNVFFRSSNLSQYPAGQENVTTLFVASNRGRIVQLFDNPYHRSQLFRMGLRPETAVRCAFDFLFSPTDSLLNAMDREFKILESSDALKISVNIRVGDATFDPEYDSTVTLEPYLPYFDCAREIETFALVPNQKVVWYVTSDSLRLRQLVKQRYGAKVLTEENLRYMHGDCGDSKAKRYGNCTPSASDFSIRMAAGQILAMSMCDYHVTSLISGFGRLSAALSHHWHNIYQVHNQNRSCTPTSYDTYESVTTIGAGI